MADARTKIEFLYKEVLGDVHTVLEQMESLKQEIPAAADAMADKLNVQTGHYLMAAEKLSAVLKGMSEEIDRAAVQAANQASAAVKHDIGQAASLAASQAVSASMGKEVDKLLASMREASKLVRWKFSKVVGCMVGAAILGGLVAMLGAHYLPVGGKARQAQELSEADRMALENGRALGLIWNSLSDKERARIQELAKDVRQK